MKNSPAQSTGEAGAASDPDWKERERLEGRKDWKEGRNERKEGRKDWKEGLKGHACRHTH